MATEDEGTATSDPAPPRIVVGVDGSPTSLEALEWAVREARLRGATLEVLHAAFSRRDALDLDAFEDLKRRERAVLDEAVAKARALAPDINVAGRLCDPPAAEVLIEASKGAGLLVVGSRGLGPLKGLTLGSVSEECARHAHCPLVIVRSARCRKALVAEPA